MFLDTQISRVYIELVEIIKDLITTLINYQTVISLSLLMNNLDTCT